MVPAIIGTIATTINGIIPLPICASFPSSVEQVVVHECGYSIREYTFAKENYFLSSFFPSFGRRGVSSVRMLLDLRRGMIETPITLSITFLRSLSQRSAPRKRMISSSSCFAWMLANRLATPSVYQSAKDTERWLLTISCTLVIPERRRTYSRLQCDASSGNRSPIYFGVYACSTLRRRWEFLSDSRNRGLSSDSLLHLPFHPFSTLFPPFFLPFREGWISKGRLSNEKRSFSDYSTITEFPPERS